ncbi:protelomerase family protein [Synechococcus elongatus]|uniref:Telomere resolvase ResT/TelK catalytic domain-containing protein n=1 Tax=Synechococcus elongatus PCC 11801 TaxID=2219813 RepID=A0AAN1QLM0_SYNEL|nr:hypothetical protein [Synechococcus elongatus]AZB71601.1 hypothetical protein DOP62_01650 [Synechococcus elongatus PCC 11801]
MDDQPLQEQFETIVSTICDGWEQYWNHRDVSAKKRACQYCESIVKSWIENKTDESTLKRYQSTLRNQVRHELAARGWMWRPSSLELNRSGDWEQLTPHQNVDRIPIGDEPCTWLTTYVQSLGTARDVVRTNPQLTQDVSSLADQQARIPLPPSVCQLLLGQAISTLQEFLTHQSPRLTAASLRIPHYTSSSSADPQALNPVMTMVPRLQLAYDAAIAIVILTGRRPFLEVLRDARFQPSDDGCLLIHGMHQGNDPQAKTFKIRPLGNPQLIAQAHVKVLAELTALAAWYSPRIHLDLLRQQAYPGMESSIQQYLPCLRPVLRQGFQLGSLAPIDGRIWYAQIAFQRWREATHKVMDEQTFINKVLIHDAASDPLSNLNGDRPSHRWTATDTEDLSAFLTAPV